jgi:hypothetical protein
MNRLSTLSMVVVLTIILALLAPVGLGAQGPAEVCSQGACPEDAAGTSSEGQSVEGLGGYQNYRLNGGYVAVGTGMRNRGFGTLRLRGIPAGATIFKAFLYWSIIGDYQQPRHAQGNFQGAPITGTFIGADHAPCWLSSTSSAYSYRADVTRRIGGNGDYSLTGFATGRNDGGDPWNVPVTPPLIDGASLVVIFQKAAYPPTSIIIWDGAASVPFEAASKWIQIGGFPAAANPAVAYTTFIGADGQNSAEPASTVNGNPVARADWDGTDWQTAPAYSLGNLWDTDTASVGWAIPAGATSARVEVFGSPDCLTWVAQIFSISDGRLDSDGDALLNGWEANGYNGINLPAMGASPWHKDIFVEHDWMAPCASCASHQPSMVVLNRVRDSFAAGPVAANPDGAVGVRMHNDVGQGAPYTGGNQVPHQNDVSADCNNIWAGFDAIKNANFNPARADIFHYVLWAHDICPGWGSTSGVSRGIPASDLIVSLGSWPGCGSEDARTGTYIHELGHNVGLTHGGNVGDHENYKPNLLSVMSYSFQVIGVWRDGARRWDYTRFAIAALDENALNEFTGLNGAESLAPYGTRYYSSSGTPASCTATGTFDDNTADTNIDWNRSGTITTPVARDINRNCQRSVLGPVRDEWANLVYNGGTIGLGAPQSVLGPEIFAQHPCISYEGFEDLESTLSKP